MLGKPIEKVDCRDIITLVESRATESPKLEFKAYDHTKIHERKTAKKEIKELIVKTVVGFLNTDDGEGLLVLGIEGKEHAEKLKCIPYELLGTKRDVVESKIRNWIFSSLGSIPSAITPPKIYVKAFDAEECGVTENKGWLIIVYVRRTFEALYYSKIDNTAYQRRGSETRVLKLEEVLLIVESKRQPILHALLSPEIVNDKKIRLDVLLRNNGSRPAKTFVVLIKLNKSVKIVSQSMSEKLYLKHVYPEKFSKIHEDADSITLQASKTTPFIVPLFPKTTTRVGSLEVEFKGSLENKAVEIQISAIVYTEYNFTEQQYILYKDPQSDKLLIKNISIVVKDYVTQKEIFVYKSPAIKNILHDGQEMKTERTFIVKFW